MIRNVPPPIYPLLRDTFGVSFRRICIAWNGDIYCGAPPSPDLIVHENVHLSQQSKYGPLVVGNTSEAWWGKYISDSSFRLSQEIEAYRAQYGFLKKIVKDKNELNKRLHKFACDLSGEMYGNIITHSQAMREIKTS